MLSGIVCPNIPHPIEFPSSGKFSVKFSNNEEVNISVENGYKFGGSKYKKSFVFDDLPWCFVIMNDRTYFYNRDTKRSFVEYISPDIITPINLEYILIENSGQSEKTIFSLNEEKPVLWVTNIIAYSKHVLTWLERNEDNIELCVVSLQNFNGVTDRIKIKDYSVGKNNDFILCYSNDSIFKISLNESSCIEKFGYPDKKMLIGVCAPNLAYSFDKKVNQLQIFNVDNGECVHSINVDGTLVGVNGKESFDIKERQKSFEKLDLIFEEIPELLAEAQYCRIFIYPCDWDIFYTKQTISFSKTERFRLNREEKTMLSSVNSDINISIKNPEGELLIYHNAICFYNSQESFAKSQCYSGGGYNSEGSIYIQNGHIHLYKKSVLYTLSRNGYWDNPKELNLDFSYFSQFGVVKDRETNTLKTLSAIDLGHLFMSCFINEPYLRTKKYIIFSGARIIQSENIDVIPYSLSYSLKYGIHLQNDCVYLYQYNNHNYQQSLILVEEFDSSSYKDVLLSEDGNYILYRDSDKAILKNIKQNSEQEYLNLSYLIHINGIRPLFDTPSSLQPRLINPITGQYIDSQKMSQYKFMSPDGTLYADTRLKDYIEYYFKDNNNLISHLDYQEMVKKYSYPNQEKVGSSAWKIVTVARKQFILKHFDYLNLQYPTVFYGDKTGAKWSNNVLDETDMYGVDHFLSYLIEKKGVAVIRNTHNDAEYVKIDLGSPLQFINYVAFSYDSKYVAIAGYRSFGGLLIIYNLETQEKIVHENTGRAVWNVSFSKNGSFASYTSSPETFFAAEEKEYQYDKFENRLICGKSFLTFSPDGSLFALSQQGYISKYDINGDVRYGWGHQPSSVVEVRETSNKDCSIICYSDLGDSGISGTCRADSVASVSFSNDNSRLMMVGADGVVVIRNLK